jgi:hypothetical protein
MQPEAKPRASTGAAARRRRFLIAHPNRVDYLPTPEAWAVVQRVRLHFPKATIRQVLDLLVETGGKAFPVTPANS